MQASLMAQGLTLMLAGMGTVFVFLTTLVLAMTLMSAVARRPRPTTDGPGGDEVAAITIAIRTHKSRND